MECNGFRDLLKEFNDAGTVVLGASADTLDLNQKFTDKEKYTYPLLCDVDKKLITALGIKTAGGTAQRVTYIVDKEGKIVKVYDKVTPKGHAEDVLKEVKALAGKK
ncbi:MAG: peroxiredoxin [Gemmataceae bacterium]|nr:peroxiredoxin [Gemmataceae bacterium]